MRLFVFLLILSVILVSGCTSQTDKTYYSQLKNPALNYSWDFNSSLQGGGKAWNSTYFQLKSYYFWEYGICTPPYEINYKHEEGHIYTSQLLKIEDYDKFEYDMFKISNLTDYNNFRINFSKPVSEGISDYYLISYFNNSMSERYLDCIKTGAEVNYEYKQHYQGLMFVEYALNNKLYSNLTDLVLDLDSIRQYGYYKEFTKTLPNSLTVY